MHRITDLRDLPKGKPIFIFGAADWGRILLTCLERQGGYEVAGFIDNFLKVAPAGLPLFTTQAFLESGIRDVLVLITSTQWAPIFRSFQGHEVTLCNAAPLTAYLSTTQGVYLDRAEYHRAMMYRGNLIADFGEYATFPEMHRFGTPTREEGLEMARSSARSCLECLCEAMKLNRYPSPLLNLDCRSKEVSCLSTLGEHAEAASILRELIRTPFPPDLQASPTHRHLPKRLLAEGLEFLDEAPLRAHMEALDIDFALKPWRLSESLEFDAWAGEAGVSVHTIEPARTLRYPFEVHDQGALHAAQTVIHQPPLLAARAQAVTVLDGILPLAPGGGHLRDPGQFRSRMYAMPSVIAETRRRIMHEIPEAWDEVDLPCIFFGGHLQYRDNYWHFMTQHVSRLALLLDHPEYADLPVAIGGEPTHTQDAILTAIGVPPERRIIVSEMGPTRFRNVVIISPPEYGRSAAKGEMDALRRRITGHFGCAGTRAHRALYLSRSGRYRSPINEPRLQEIARGLGFEVVDAGSLPFAEQVRLFASARVVCGPFGAAFANTAFTPPGAAIISLGPREITSKELINPAAVLGHSFLFCLGNMIADAHGHWNSLLYEIDESAAQAVMALAIHRVMTPAQVPDPY